MWTIRQRKTTVYVRETRCCSIFLKWIKGIAGAGISRKRKDDCFPKWLDMVHGKGIESCSLCEFDCATRSNSKKEIWVNA